MRVLVTGGAGFIGSAIARRLVIDGHEVGIIDDLSGGYWRNLPPTATFYEGTLTDAAFVNLTIGAFRPEVIIHAAAYAAEGLSHWMRRYCFTQNLVSWANLANAAAIYEVRRVLAFSSMSVYGSQEPPFTEDMAPQPEDPYGATKAAIEADLRALAAVQGTEWIIVRPHNVYGLGQNLADPYRNVVAIFMRQALAGEPLTIFGDGRQVRAFSYIDDVSRAIARMALGPRHGYIVNVGGDEPIEIGELAERVIATTKSPSTIVHLPERYEVREAYCNHDMLRRLTDWHPTSMHEGLAMMATWARGLEIGPLRVYDYEVDRRLFAAWHR